MVTAYTLAFGTLLVLGGRIADYTGRKRTFVIGLIGFAVASAIGGLAPNQELLFAARALQGAFAALMAPASLSIVTVTFTEPQERAKAFGVFGALAGGGAAIGLIVGGLLTEYASWRWCLTPPITPTRTPPKSASSPEKPWSVASVAMIIVAMMQIAPTARSMPAVRMCLLEQQQHRQRSGEAAVSDGEHHKPDRQDHRRAQGRVRVQDVLHTLPDRSLSTGELGAGRGRWSIGSLTPCERPFST